MHPLFYNTDVISTEGLVDQKTSLLGQLTTEFVLHLIQHQWLIHQVSIFMFIMNVHSLIHHASTIISVHISSVFLVHLGIVSRFRLVIIHQNSHLIYNITFSYYFVKIRY